MYRLLIVDDEPAIVKGLKKIFEEESQYEFEIYKAYSAKEAITIMESIRPDILLSDIHMPEITGLKLGEEVKRKWPMCQIIFLTGHNEFEYIYKAINEIKAGYLLKSEDDMKLVSEVEKAIDQIEQIKKVQMKQILQDDRAIESQNDEYLIRNQLIENILLYGIRKQEAMEMSIKLNIDFNQSTYIYIGKLVHDVKDLVSTNKDINHIKQVLDKVFKQYYVTESLIYRQIYIVWLLQPKQVEDIQTRLLQVSEECQEVGMELFKWPFRVIYSGQPMQVEKLSAEFGKLFYFINREKDVEVPQILDLSMTELLSGKAERGDSGDRNDLIEKLELYIKEHIGEELTLTKLASVIHLNPCYLSRYYTKITGTNLSDFIKEVKIEKSKGLLLETNKKIGDIAVELGFDSQSYFCRIFKKNVGKSPVEYRRGN